MADIDLLPARGIPFRARVDANGIALGGTATIDQLAQRGMHPVCIVDNAGLIGGVTIDQLAQRGIRAACLVDENGLAGGVPADDLRRRGIRPLAPLTATGFGPGATTVLQLAQRGLDYACLVDESGGEAPGAAATAYVARATGIDATHKSVMTSLLNGLAADATLPLFDFIQFYAHQTSALGLLNLVSSSFNGVLIGAPAFVADRGFLGVAGSATIAINTQFNPTTAPSPKYTQNGAHQMCWSLSDLLGPDPMCGAFSPSTAYIWPRFTDGNAFLRMNNGNTGGVAVVTDSIGCYVGVRTGPNDQQIYKNGALRGFDTADASTGVPNFPFYVLAGNQAGSQTGGWGGRCAVYTAGGPMNAGQAASVYSRFRTALTALGVP